METKATAINSDEKSKLINVKSYALPLLFQKLFVNLQHQQTGITAGNGKKTENKIQQTNDLQTKTITDGVRNEQKQRAN